MLSASPASFAVSFCVCWRCQRGSTGKVLTRKRRILEKYDISYPRKSLVTGQSDTYFPVLKKKIRNLCFNSNLKKHTLSLGDLQICNLVREASQEVHL
jgi:hypothetical protein